MPELRIDPLTGLRVAIGPTALTDSEAPLEPAAVEDDPLAGGSGQPQMFAARADAGLVETIESVPGPVGSLLDLGADGLERTMGLWRERMRAHADAPFRHLVVDEGVAEAGGEGGADGLGLSLIHI